MRYVCMYVCMGKIFDGQMGALTKFSIFVFCWHHSTNKKLVGENGKMPIAFFGMIFKPSGFSIIFCVCVGVYEGIDKLPNCLVGCILCIMLTDFEKRAESA